MTTTQDLLLDLVPVVEDMTEADAELRTKVAESVEIRREARQLVLRSRRQRLDLRLVKT